MGKTVLPKSVREKIKDLFRDGYSSVEVFDAVVEEARDYVDSHEQLSKCIAGLKWRVGKAKKPKQKPTDVPLCPEPKAFDTEEHQRIIDGLTERTLGKEFEQACDPIAFDILENYESFKKVEKGPSRWGTPFDFFGYKDGAPYIIELKSSLHTFHAPGETQKRRLQKLLKRLPGLKIALLQVKLRDAAYRIFYNEQMNSLFDGREAPLKPVEDWITDRMSEGGTR